MSNPLILVDGSSYFFRAFHALPPLVSSKGQPTGAIYGVANMVKRLIKDYAAQDIVVVFDDKGKTFRDELYPEYKAHRPPTPEDLKSQFEPLIEVLNALGLAILIIPGVEADDVIGTIAKSATHAKRQVIISTGDKDLAQLVNEHVTLINTMTNVTMDEEGVINKFGVKPKQIIDYLTLVGDSSDNIPGVRKCGPKTAVKWLTTYQTLDNLIANADDIGGKIGENLREDIPKLSLSKQLVTIKTDVDLPTNLDAYKLKQVDKAKLLALAKEFEFKSWIKELTQNNNTQPVNTGSHTIITNANQFDELITNISKCELLCIDTETTSLDAIQAKLVGISICTNDNPVYIPLCHTETSQQLDINLVLNSLKPILEDKNVRKLGQNLKYDYQIFKNYGISLQGIESDTMLESYLLNSSTQRHDMDSLALKYLSHNTIKYSEVTKIGGKSVNFSEVPIAEAAKYAAEDAFVTLRLHQVLYPMLADSLKTVLHEIEIPLITILAEMERHGVLIDVDRLSKLECNFAEEIKTLQEQAFSLVGHEFNLSSPKQLSAIFYEELKIPVTTKTPTGQPSTSETVLKDLAHDYELPAIILRHRTLSKLLSTYVIALQKKANPNTSRIHTSYNQAVTATGRLSSSDPNLQNIPVRDEEGRLIRKAFIAPNNFSILSADYSQIELRIMAHFSKDKALLDAFSHGLDIHKTTASEIFNTPLDLVTSEQRRRAKAVNFGLIYGMSAFGLAKQLGVERKEAQEYIDLYFARYPAVLEYMNNTRELAHTHGYVETLFGRRLYLPEINVSNNIRRKASERAAINAPLQGTAADIIKKAMINFANWQNKQQERSINMIMQVHDELVFEVSNHKLEFAKEQIKSIMENISGLSVPLVVSVGVGNNWDDAKA